MDFQLDPARKAILDETHRSGENCCQAVCAAFAADFQIDPHELACIGAGFGGGMGYYGLTCGALAGAVMVFSNRYGADFIGDAAYKRAFYAAVKSLCEAFEARAGAATCNTLRKMRAEENGLSCQELIYLAAELTEEFLKKYETVLTARTKK